MFICPKRGVWEVIPIVSKCSPVQSWPPVLPHPCKEQSCRAVNAAPWVLNGDKGKPCTKGRRAREIHVCVCTRESESMVCETRLGDVRAEWVPGAAVWPGGQEDVSRGTLRPSLLQRQSHGRPPSGAGDDELSLFFPASGWYLAQVAENHPRCVLA